VCVCVCVVCGVVCLCVVRFCGVCVVCLCVCVVCLCGVFVLCVCGVFVRCVCVCVCAREAYPFINTLTKKQQHRPIKLQNWTQSITAIITVHKIHTLLNTYEN
jgi:hypothetical protein